MVRDEMVIFVFNVMLCPLEITTFAPEVSGINVAGTQFVLSDEDSQLAISAQIPSFLDLKLSVEEVAVVALTITPVL